MKKHIIFAVIALCIFAACKESEELEIVTITIEAEPLTAEKEAEFIPAAADLTVELFKQSFAEQPENTLVSPLSVLLALAMTANGADGTTLEEMEAVLGRGTALAELNQMLASYVSNLPSEEGSKLNIANSIWFRDSEGFSVEDDFLNVNTEFYAAEIRKAPFNQDTVREINDWVSRMTDEMITEIIDDIAPDTVMHLINAIAFDSEWAKPYEGRDVAKREFTAFDGRVQTSDFMFSTEEMYIEARNAAGFIKPYSGGHYSFAALLPNSDVGIEDFISDMTGESLMAMLNSARRHSWGVITWLPKFTFEYGITMNNVLAGMGMPTAFSERAADFSRLGRSSEGNLFIGKVSHKTFIEVDERGTRAAAVTDVAVTRESEPRYAYVILDRPFVFAIIDNASNLPVFIGALLEIPDNF
jgi:serpin B